jgi:hypothetical protein
MRVFIVVVALFGLTSSACFTAAGGAPSSAPASHRVVTAAAVLRQVSRRRITPFGGGDYLLNLRCSVVANGTKARCVGTPADAGNIDMMAVWFKIRPDGTVTPICTGPLATGPTPYCH